MRSVAHVRELTKKLERSIARSIAARGRGASVIDARTSAHGFLENADWYLPDELAVLGTEARVFPGVVSESVTGALDSALDFVAAYLSLCAHVMSLAGSRWRIPGRPWRKTAVLSGLLHRSMAATNETFVLLQGGFPDGAEARMRTVVESAVIANFIDASKVEIAERYYASHFVEIWRRKEDGHLRGLTEDFVRLIDKRYDRTISRFGESISKPYGWASPAFNGRRVTFSDINRAYGDVDLGSRFANASHHVHATPTGTVKSEAADADSVFLYGPRPKGALIPAYECLDSLHRCACAFLSSVLRSCPRPEVVYWEEILHYTMKEAQLELVHAEVMVDPDLRASWMDDHPEFLS